MHGVAADMGISQNRGGTPFKTPNRNEPLKGNPQIGAPVFGNPHGLKISHGADAMPRG